MWMMWSSGAPSFTNVMTKVLQRVRENGLKLNCAKCQFGVQEITLLGDKMSARGIEPDERKIKAVLDMPRHN